MNDSFRILASDREELLRQRRKTRRIVFSAVIISLIFFSYPLLKEYRPASRSLKAARKLGQYISMLKTLSITKHQAIELKLLAPDRIEVFEGSSCEEEVNFKKLYDLNLDTFEPKMVFLTDEWVKKNIQNAPLNIKKICFDVNQGGFVSDQLLSRYENKYGSVFLGDIEQIQKFNEDSFFEPFSEVQISGQNADIQIQ